MLSILFYILCLPSMLADNRPEVTNIKETNLEVTLTDLDPMPPANGCLQALECTRSGTGNFSGCQPAKIKEYRIFFIANAVTVMFVGITTNLFTLIAVPYARFK